MDEKKKKRSAEFARDKNTYAGGSSAKRSDCKKAKQQQSGVHQPRDADDTSGKNDFSEGQNTFTEEEGGKQNEKAKDSRDDYRRRDTYHKSEKKGRYRRREYQDRERTKTSDFGRDFQTKDTTFSEGAETEFQGSKKLDRLQKKAEKAGKKTEAARKKLPKKREYSLERVFDEKTGRASYVLTAVVKEKPFTDRNADQQQHDGTLHQYALSSVWNASEAGAWSLRQLGGIVRGNADSHRAFQYAAGMQIQLAVMADELQGVREQLAQIQAGQPKAVTESLMDKGSHLQEKIVNLSECLSVVKNHLVETAAQAVNAFKEKGKAEMCKVLQKGISGVKSMLADYRERLTEVMMDYKKTANQIDSIGDELKQIGNSVSNVGRLLAGKGTKEVSGEKPGVGLTRAINKPIKRAAKNLQKNIDTVDKAFEKLERLSERLAVGKEAEKGGRVSLKDKLSQMKAKADQQKNTPEPDKSKSKEVCI